MGALKLEGILEAVENTDIDVVIKLWEKPIVFLLENESEIEKSKFNQFSQQTPTSYILKGA
jgi:hypothetical protein